MVKLALVVALLGTMAASAAPLTDGAATPNFWDQKQRLSRVDLSSRPRIRFVTSVDYPPFNFLDQQGRLTGFNVDLARMICEELGVVDRCQIEAKPFADLVPALLAGDAEAVVAGVALTAENRRQLGFTESYLRYPARFIARRDAPLPSADETGLAGVRIGVVRGSAHGAMLAAFFPKAVATAFDDRTAALEALKRKEIAGVFGDGVFLSFWLDSDASGDCCAFSGGPYLSERFLGEGLAIAVPRADEELARAFDYALGQIVAKGRFSELLLRYFPRSAF